MDWWQIVLVAVAGAAAGLINAVVGSGTLITFPTLLALGVPPVIANVSNTIGLAPGTLSGALACRADLVGQRQRVVRYGSASLVGSVAGALLLLWLPPSAFRAIVPVLIGLGIVLVLVGPWLSRRPAGRRHGSADRTDQVGPWWLFPAVIITGAYGGYFGAAQGVLIIAVLGVAVAESMPRINALKNALATVANTVAGVIYIVVAPVDRVVIIAIAAGSVVGAQIGARLGRRLPPTVYRAFIVVVGIAAIVNLLR